MSTDWLAAQSFHQSQMLLGAINALCIHTKLELAGRKVEENPVPVVRAREAIATFLGQLDKAVAELESQHGGLVFGKDARQRQLVASFVEARHDPRRSGSTLFHDPLPDIRRLLFSSKVKDHRLLMNCLRDLRVLLEEHVQEDTLEILGEL